MEYYSLGIRTRLSLKSLRYLNFGQNGHDGHDDAENEVEADEDLVLRAVVGFGIKHVEEHDGGESQGEVEDGDGQQSCEEDDQNVVHLIELSPFKRPLGNPSILDLS